ncbi:MAG TPA: glycoside hydrolase family 15 protein [Steroidobacteraceae bacterium]|nr:glycoside hydrolase family 15 protein [Steroidobacteraceae bacterium]
MSLPLAEGVTPRFSPRARWIAAVTALSAVASPSWCAIPLVSGNGFGFAVVNEATGHLTRFYAHPYAFVHPDRAHPLAEGVATTNFIADLAPRSLGAEASVRYIDQSQVIRVSSQYGTGTVFMPFGLLHPALIIDWQSPSDAAAATVGWTVRWTHPVVSRADVTVSGVRVEVLRFRDTPEALCLIPLDPARSGDAGDDSDLRGHAAWALTAVEPGRTVAAAVRSLLDWRAGHPVTDLIERELSDLEHWRVRIPASVTDRVAREVWRQSEVVLRMAQSREPNSAQRHGSGLIVASLPDGLWFTPWVRDMAYAALALIRMGHFEEARAALAAYFNARPTGLMRRETAGADYQISVVRYFGDGAEEPFFTMEGSTNVELDNWGLALWVLGEYLERSADKSLLSTRTYRGTVYESARDFIVRPLLASLEPYSQGLIVRADTSIWEEHERDRKHFAYTTAAAIAGLGAFARIAERQHDARQAAALSSTLERLRQGFASAFASDGRLRGTLEPGIKNEIDGALLAIIEMGVVEDPKSIADVVERMPLLKVASGGYRRVRSVLTDPAVFEYWYEREEFVFVDLSLSGVLRRLGRHAEAAALLQRVLQKAAEYDDFVPEMYVAEPCQLFPGKVGDPTGAMPMVGYGAGAVILELLGPLDERSREVVSKPIDTPAKSE